MKAGPDIARIAALMGDPARANMLTALMGGEALTASELANAAGVAPSTASSHLSQLEASGIVAPRRQGRHRYYRLGGNDVAGLIETLMGVAETTGGMRLRTGPREPALRRARVCYDHLAGDLGVELLDRLYDRGFVRPEREMPQVTAEGRGFLAGFGIDLEALEKGRRPLCRECLDWSVRRPHLAGALGAALLQRIYDLKWARRDREGRAVIFTPDGERRFAEAFLR